MSTGDIKRDLKSLMDSNTDDGVILRRLVDRSADKQATLDAIEIAFGAGMVHGTQLILQTVRGSLATAGRA